MRLRVGLTSLAGSIEEYARRFDLLELRADPQRLPSEKALRRLRATAGERVEFSLLVPAETTRRALENAAELAPTLSLAQAIEPSWVVFQTGPSVGPSARTRARFETLVAALGQVGRKVGWEPRGPFEPEVAREWSDALEISLVEDLSQVDEALETERVYTRLRAEGSGARLAGGALERLAEKLSSAQEAFVVIEGRASPNARTRVRQAIESQLGLASFGAPDDDDEADDEGDDLEQEFEDEEESGGDSGEQAQ